MKSPLKQRWEAGWTDDHIARVEELFQSYPSEMRAMTDRASKAVTAMWDELYRLDDEAKWLFANADLTPRFRPTMLPPREDNDPIVSISLHETEQFKSRATERREAERRERWNGKKRDRLELSYYELRSKIN